MFDEGDEALVMGHRPGEHGSRAVNALLSTIVRTMTEMEQGLRPVAALDTIASPLAARRIRHQVHEMQLGKRTGKRGGRPRTTPATVLNASSFHPTAGVTEGVVVIESDGRSRAYCIRLEQEATRWRLVELATPGGTLRAAVTEASRSGAVPIDEHGMRRSSGRGGISYSTAPWPPRDHEPEVPRDPLGRTPSDALSDALYEQAHPSSRDAAPEGPPDAGPVAER